jgi:hypothetical protein
MMNSFMEGSRITATVGLYRDAVEPTVVEDGGVKINLKANQRVLCNLVCPCFPFFLPSFFFFPCSFRSF